MFNCLSRKKREINLKQIQLRHILDAMQKDFLSLLCFMIVYHKYPYNLAYLRITEILQFLDTIQCKNKLEIISEELFNWADSVAEAQHIVEHYYHFIKEETASKIIKNSTGSHKNGKDFTQYELSHYFYPPDDFNFNSLQIAQNFLKFKKLFLIALQNDKNRFLRDDDFWHYACEYLLMEDNNFQMFVFGPAGKNFSFFLEKDEVSKEEQRHDL